MKLRQCPKLLCKKAKFYNWPIKNQFKLVRAVPLPIAPKHKQREEGCAARPQPGKWLLIDISHLKN